MDPGAGGPEACEAVGLQAASAKQAASSRTSGFIDFQAPGEAIRGVHLKRNETLLGQEPVSRASRLDLERNASWTGDPLVTPALPSRYRCRMMNGPDLRDRGQHNDHAEHDA
jgi:hypothetical protein